MESTTTTEQREEYLKSCTTGNRAFNGSTISPDITHNTSLLYYALKRLIDIVLAALGVVVLIPVFLVIAICIKFDDGGDILYFREMIGLQGRRFTILKFRTMIPNADAYLEQHPELQLEFEKNMKLKVDPRVTRLGRFLRKTYLDELPQLFNVLAGHMSLVGPRSLPAHELTLYGEYAQKRLTVKPGITGSWQVSENRYSSYTKRILLDIHYIDNRSFFLDLIILLKTLKVLYIQAGV
jgi:lipopolysaccharide/colanic/teichoic acid biosynthesis glycosyltransferase